MTESIDTVTGGVEFDLWHWLKCLESWTVLLEAKDGGYAPLGEDEIFKGKRR